MGFKGGWGALCLKQTPGKEGSSFFLLAVCRILIEAPQDEDIWGAHTDHSCSELGLDRQRPSATATILLPLQDPAMPTLRQLQRPPDTSSPINASSVAWAWEGGPGNAVGPSQPGPLSGWHWAGLLGTDLRVSILRA